MSGRNGAVTPGPSRECDMTSFFKGRPKSAQQLRDSAVAARRAQSVTVPSSRVSRECRSSRVKVPPFKKMPGSLDSSRDDVRLGLELGIDGNPEESSRSGVLRKKKSEVSKRGWREGVGDKQTPKRSPKSFPEMCPSSLKGA